MVVLLRRNDLSALYSMINKSIVQCWYQPASIDPKSFLSEIFSQRLIVLV